MALDEVAVNLYQTLYAVPVPQVGTGVAPTALFKFPKVIEQDTPGVSVPGEAQLACAEALVVKTAKRKNRVVVRKVVSNMVLQGFKHQNY